MKDRIVVYFDQRFCAKKLKKGKKDTNLVSNLAKKKCFLSLHQNAGRVFYYQIYTTEGVCYLGIREREERWEKHNFSGVHTVPLTYTVVNDPHCLLTACKSL